VTFFTLKSADDGHQTDPSLETVGLEAMPLLRPLVISGPSAKRTLVGRLSAYDFDLVHASFWFSSLDFDLPKSCRRLGIPIDPSNLDEQLQGVLRMLIDLPWLAGPLGEEAPRRVLERFSLAANIDTLVALYREVARQ
jgi:hypothetical protein